jgi:tetratricopeptide (TPR) repeat protein
VTLLFPVVFFVLLELGLRWSGYGPNLALFITDVQNGKQYHLMNPEVKSRYFYRVPFSPSTSTDYFLVPKPAGTFRIICLGGSTTVGFPYYYNTSFSSFLRDRLRLVFPERKIEVINLGMTATNSFTTLDMAREVVDYEPDLVIVYDGHNEFYGALGVASNESMGRARWLQLLSLKVIRLKTVLLLRDLLGKAATLVSGPPPDTRGLGMMAKLARDRTIPYGSPLYQRALETWRANLADLTEVFRDHGVPLIMGTQVSNLRDLKPFVSTLPDEWTPARREQFHQLVNAGLEQGLNGRPDTAAGLFRQALALDGHHAETRYLLARSLDTLGRKGEAEAEYRLARDYDELRFRTSTDFNDVLRAFDDHGTVAVADMEAAFRAESPDSLIGKTLILEHLHPNARGYFVLAKEYARVMKHRGFLAPPEVWAARDTIPDRKFWEERNTTELDERIAGRRTEVLLSAWPFAEGIPVVDAIPPTDTLGQLADRVASAQLFWHEAHWEAVRFYYNRRDARSLEREYRTLISQLPLFDVQPYLQLARLLLDQQRIPEVRALLEASLDVKPTILACRALGDIALNAKSFEQAAKMYERTFAFPQTREEQAENGNLLAVALFRLGRREAALSRVNQVLAAKPDYLPAVQLLAEINSSSR